MLLQVYTSTLLFSQVDVEVRLCTEGGDLIRDKELNVNITPLDANTLLPVSFQMNGEEWNSSAPLIIGSGGYAKSLITFDLKETSIREIIFRATIMPVQDFFDSEPVKLIKYRIELHDVRLTDDISKYNGDEGVHYTNNDSARIKVLYKVYDEYGLVTDPKELSNFQNEVNSKFLFANGDEVQYIDENGDMVKFTEIDCAVKRKHKEEDKSRVLKKVFEEKSNELKIAGRGGVVSVFYRINMFSSHQKLKQYNLSGRKYTIELRHPLAVPISIPPVRILTKYHRTIKKEKNVACKKEDTSHDAQIVKEEKIIIKKEIKTEQEGLCESDNNNNNQHKQHVSVMTAISAMTLHNLG